MFGKVTIAMATYNGAHYLDEQLNSIINQTYQNWELIIRDDNSKDKTIDILKKYSESDDRISYILGTENIGPAMNFNELIRHSLDSDYLMFADQDDIWFEDKVEISLIKMKEMEEMKGEDIPVLIYTNLKYVDENLVDISKKRCNPHIKSIKTLLGFNYIWGCTMLLNRSLINIVYPVSIKAQNHDYWVALNAQLSGIVVHIDVETIFYRQHSNNVTGGINNFSFIAKLKTMRKLIQSYDIQIEQNLAFSSKYKLNDTVHKYESIVYSRGLLSVVRAMKFRLRKNTLIETVFYYIYLAFRKPNSKLL